MRAIRQTSGRPIEEVQKGELKKITPEIILQNTDKKLEKIETRTEFLIKKSRKLNDKTTEDSTASIQQANNIPTSTLQHSRLVASFFDYLSMSPKKIPKQILNYIKEKHFIHNSNFFSLIDSYELSQRTGKSAHHLSTQISRMEEQGWFKIIKSSSGGHRTIQIDPTLYGIPTSTIQH